MFETTEQSSLIQFVVYRISAVPRESLVFATMSDHFVLLTQPLHI